MVNKMAKMRRTHKKVRDYYENLGWEVEFTPHSRWKKDFFGGLFDAVMIKPVSPTSNHSEVALVQVKSNSFPSAKPFVEFKRRYPEIRVILVRWVSHRGLIFKEIELPEKVRGMEIIEGVIKDGTDDI